MKRAYWLLLSVGVFLWLSSTPAKADTVIFDDFGSGYTYNCCVGWTVAGSGIGLNASANLFTAAASGNVTQIDVALGLAEGTGGATVSLWTNNSGVPGVQLGSWNVTAGETFGNCCGIVTVTGISGVDLTGGETYLLVLAAIESDTWDAWNWNDQGATGLAIYTTDGGTTWSPEENDTLGAFDILAGTSIPEPATMLLLGTGLLGLIAFRGKRGWTK